MINLYMTPNYRASDKAKIWLKNQGLVFKEFNILKQTTNLHKVLFEILPLLEGDAYDIISTRGKDYKVLEKKLGDLSLSQLIDYLVSKPKLLKQPILYDGKRVQIGFNPDDIRIFIPQQNRQLKFELVKEHLKKEEDYRLLRESNGGEIYQ
jgi:regulatory protein spx